MRATVILFLAIIFCDRALGQVGMGKFSDESLNFQALNKFDKRFGLSAGLNFGLIKPVGIYKLQVDYFVKPQFNVALDALLGINGYNGAAVEAKYFFVPHLNKKFRPYAGANFGIFAYEYIIQLPVGISFMTKIGFEAKLGLNGYYNPSYSNSGILAELLLGWRF